MIIKIFTFFALILSLFDYKIKSPDKVPIEEPQILDGPGMVYVDSEYRNDYANCLPFPEWQGEPYLAIAYLGKGNDGKANKDVYINKLFEGFDDEKINQIKTFEYEGDDWFLVVPRYYDTVIIKKFNEETYTEYGVPFVVKCNSDVVINIFNVDDMYFALAVDENGKLKGTEHDVWEVEDSTTWGKDNFVWDIAHLISER